MAGREWGKSTHREASRRARARERLPDEVEERAAADPIEREHDQHAERREEEAEERVPQTGAPYDRRRRARGRREPREQLDHGGK